MWPKLPRHHLKGVTELMLCQGYFYSFSFLNNCREGVREVEQGQGWSSWAATDQSNLLCTTTKQLAQLSVLPYILCITLCYLLIATCYLLLVTSAHTMYHIVLCTCLLFRCAAARIPRIYLGRSVGRWVNVVASWVIVQTLGNRSLGNQKKSVEVSRKSVEYR